MNRNNPSHHKKLALLGVGEVLELINDDVDSYGLQTSSTRIHFFESVGSISKVADEIIYKLDPNEYDLFVAVDSNALNHARLELYGRARMAGFHMVNLIHKSAQISNSVTLADNIFIGPNVFLGPGSKISSNTFIGTYSLIDSNVTIASHCWIGAGSRVGSHTKIDCHVVLGDDTRIETFTEIEHHVLIEQIGPWKGKWLAGTYLEKSSANSATTAGPSYSYSRKQVI